MTIEEAAIALSLSREAIKQLIQCGHIALTNESILEYKERQEAYQAFLSTGF